MPCLFFDARPRESFALRWPHRSCLFTPIGPPSPLTLRARNTFGPHRIAADCPLLFRRSTSTLTPESLFISCRRTRTASWCSFVFPRERTEKQYDGNGAIGGRSTLIKVALTLFLSCADFGNISGKKKRNRRPHLSPLNFPAEHLRSRSNMKDIRFCNTFTFANDEEIDRRENNSFLRFPDLENRY